MRNGNFNHITIGRVDEKRLSYSLQKHSLPKAIREPFFSLGPKTAEVKLYSIFSKNQFHPKAQIHVSTSEILEFSD